MSFIDDKSSKNLQKVAIVAIFVATMAKSVGIKELKDRASSIVDEVEKKKKAVTITRNNKEVARIVPVTSGDLNPSDLLVLLKDAGRVSQIPILSLKSLKLKKIQTGDESAIRAITEDRDER
jgi:prevent-host-death family protein